MNTALNIISIQYELVLALGDTPDLKPMLQQFLRICTARLNLRSAHVFLYHNQEQQPCHKQQSSSTLNHVVSIPSQCQGQPWASNTLLLDSAENFEKQSEPYKALIDQNKKFYLFRIDHFGLLAVEYHNASEITLEQTLGPIMNRLAMSCSAAIKHDTLTQEIQARKAAEEQILFQASHDDLTGLYNRREITHQLEALLSRCQHHDHCGALLFIDLNDFKSINDLLGHNVGDQVLRDVANRLYQMLPSDQVIARFGGDEFVVLLESADKPTAQKDIDRLIHRIIEQIDRPFTINGNNYSLSCCIGYDLFTCREKSAAEIIKHADLALHEAKHQGRKYGLAYDSAMSDRLDQQINYTIELKEALEKNEFELHYQPQYDNEGQLIGAEALLRWKNPKRGYESPAIYIPIAEKSDLIIHISKWVLHQACKDIKQLEDNGLPECFKKLSINISAKHMALPGFVDDILSAVNQYAIKPSHFAIEITEGIMVGDIEHSINVLSTLKAQGIDCSIDDFGTGYSSLIYLKKLPASVIKIDRSFVKDMDEDNDNRSIANMIIGLAKNLGMDIIAEGVETQAELDCLQDMECHQYQGYFFCKPVPFSELQKRIENPSVH